MKMYLNTEQTAKLIELGFEHPKSVSNLTIDKELHFKPSFNYSIGELIEMLPKTINHKIWWGNDKGAIGCWGLRIDTECTEYIWTITYERPHSAPIYLEGKSELIDALYEMVVKLKEEGVL